MLYGLILKTKGLHQHLDTTFLIPLSIICLRQSSYVLNPLRPQWDIRPQQRSSTGMGPLAVVVVSVTMYFTGW